MLTPNYTYKAKIINVVDGDTVDAQVDVGFRIVMTQRLRLNLINAGELHSKDLEARASAVKAKDFVKEAILGKDVIVTTYKADSFGRYLSDVYYSKEDQQVQLNNEMLSLGLCVLYQK